MEWFTVVLTFDNIISNQVADENTPMTRNKRSSHRSDKCEYRGVFNHLAGCAGTGKLFARRATLPKKCLAGRCPFLIVFSPSGGTCTIREQTWGQFCSRTTHFLLQPLKSAVITPKFPRNILNQSFTLLSGCLAEGHQSSVNFKCFGFARLRRICCSSLIQLRRTSLGLNCSVFTIIPRSACPFPSAVRVEFKGAWINKS